MGVRLKIGSGEDRVVEVRTEEIVIGREETSGLVIDDSEISRNHASVRLLDPRSAELRDLGSSNGSFVDGRQIEGAVTLTGGETVRLGQTEITVEADSPASAETKIGTSPPPAGQPTAAAPIPPPQPQPPTEEQPPAPTTQSPAQPPPPPPTPAPPPAATPPPPAPPQQPFATPAAQAPAAKGGGGSGKLWLLIGGGVLALLIAAAAVWYFVIRETDEGAINSLIELVADGDPAVCDRFTDGFFETESPDATLDEAKASCREGIVDPAEGFELENLQITGNRATASVTTVGGESDGEVEDLVFLNEGGEWKIDSFTSAG